MARNVAIILAAGRGTRMGRGVPDKVLLLLGGKPVLAHSLDAFAAAGVVDEFVIVHRDAAQRARLARVLARSGARRMPVTWVRGGRERQESVERALARLRRRRGLEAVFIHDAARPLVRVEMLRRLATAVHADGAACLAHRVTDTIKRIPAGAGLQRARVRTVPRDELWAMETPQAFAFTTILEAYADVRRGGRRITDDAAALEAGRRRGVTLVENPHPNPKLTRVADVAFAEFLLAAEAAKP